MENKGRKTEVERHIQWGPYYASMYVPAAEKLVMEKVAFTIAICAIAVDISLYPKVLPLTIPEQKLQSYRSRVSNLGPIQFLERMMKSEKIYQATRVGIKYPNYGEEYHMTLFQEGKLVHTRMTPAEKALILG